MEYLNRRKFIGRAGLFSAGTALGMSALANGMGIGEDLKERNFFSKSLKDKKASHPSLHFDAKGLKTLRKQAKGTHKRYAVRLFEWVDKNRSWSPPPVTGAQGDEVALEESGAFLTNAAFAYCLSGKDQHFQLARKWALKMCDFPDKAIENYGIGIYAVGLARTFDWLYHDLETTDRETLKSTVVKVVQGMYENAQPGAENPSWWAKSYLHHDFWIPMGGFGESALALIGETDGAVKYAEFAKQNFDIAFSWMGDDGAWHEGVADWCYAMAPMLWFYGAWQGITGEDLHERPWIRNTANYRLYHWLPNNQYINLDDSFRSGRYSTSGSASSHLMRRLASVFRDGHAQWLAEKDEEFDYKPSPKGAYMAPYEGLSYRPEPLEYPYPESQTATWNMLWYDPSVETKSPTDLPAAHHYDNLDMVVMRTGWSKEDAVISHACGPIAGHALAEVARKGTDIAPNIYYHDHVDYNSFTLFANDQYFIIPAGYARRASHFQNVVSINGADFSADPRLEIKMAGFRTGSDFSYAVGDATEGFLPEPGIESYRRHMVLVKNEYLVIFDDLKLSEEGRKNWIFNRFSWTAHSDPNTHDFTIDGKQVEWKTEGKPALNMCLLEPPEFGWERQLFQSLKGEPMMEALRLSKPEYYGYTQQVLSVWAWNPIKNKPEHFRNEQFTSALLGDELAVAFSVSSDPPSDFSDERLNGREMLLFGASPDTSDGYMRIKDGKVSNNN